MEYSDGVKYNNLREEEQLNKLKIVFNELGDRKTLDVGCGTGLGGRLFSDIKGVDPSKDLLKECEIENLKGEAENLPFKENEFENVICVTSIHNFEDFVKGLGEIKRVGENFGLSVLKRSRYSEEIENKIYDLFNVIKVIDEGVDKIFICDKNGREN